MEEQIELIEEISKIIKNQISDIDNLGGSIIIPDKIEDLKRRKLLQTKKFYLIFFNDIVQFLIKKLKKENDENFKFYLPNIRTLLEIYARLLYLCNQNENEQMGLCVANDLFTLNNTLTRPEKGDSKKQVISYERIKESYEKIYQYYKPFLDRENIDIPENMEEFSYNKLKRLGLNFPGVVKMLREDYITSFSLETIKVFPGIIKQIPDTYRYLCNYVHGNALSLRIHGNEKLWVIAETQIFSTLIVDLVNEKVLNESRKTELKEWMQKFIQKRINFARFWKERNKTS